jgi:predicted nucleotide-binding protein (sugar kinase/HSP70/actin superfamily)
VTPGVAHRDKILTPVIRSIYTGVYVRKQLYDMLKNIGCRDLTFRAVSNAFDRAHDHWNAVNGDLRDAMRKDAAGVDDIQVVFLGRPYSVLSRSMNNGIPEIFSKMGIRTYFQDMLDYTRDDVKEIEELLQIVHWKYAAQILESAHVVAQKRGLYPVFITSFKCTPDAYVIEFFKQILDRLGKPYLILQLDEHDSSVGYETRIEAAVRSFKNHFTATEKHTEQRPEKYHAGISVFQKDVLNGKTFLFPNWDDICCRLIVGMLRREGYDAYAVAETADSIQRSMRFNTAQCVPLNTIAQNYIDYVERHNLDPKKTVVWSPESKVSCNLGMFPLYTKKIFETYGNGMEHVSVYSGNVTFTDISARGAINAYCAFMFGGMLRKMGCHTRPYEQKPGMTDSVIAEARELLYLAFVNDTPKPDVLEKVIGMFESIPVKREERPKVAIFGDLYVRDNNVMNQNLIKIIEANGGEVVTTPYNELVRVIVDLYIRKWFKQGNYFEAAFSLLLKQVIPILDKRYGHFFDRILGESSFKVHRSSEEIMAKFNIKLHHTGESMENILKIFHLIDQYPHLSLFVQTNPSYCCPSLITEAMGDRLMRSPGYLLFPSNMTAPVQAKTRM